MGLLTHLRYGESIGFRSTYAPWDNFWFDPAPSRDANGLGPVSPEQSLRLAAVWACVGIRSEAMASVPPILYRRLDPAGKERATDRPLFNKLRWQPNPYMTSFEFEELSELHLNLRGNFYARIDEDRFGNIQQLVPLNPDRMKPGLLPAGRKAFVYSPPGLEPVMYSQEQIHHRRGKSLDGIVGLSPIEYAANTLGMAVASDAFAASSFRGGGTPPFAILSKLTLGPDGQDNLRTSLAKYRAGEKFLILEEDMTVQQLGVSQRDAQLLETRKWDLEQIARIFDVPLHMLKVTDRGVSYASVEMFDLDFVIHRIRPSAIRNEQAIWRDLLSETEQQGYFVEYLLDALLRGDSQARALFYKSAIESQWMVPNEARERENMNPRPGGDEVVTNLPRAAAPEPPGQRTPTGAPRGDADLRARLITMESCARVVQKELAAAHQAARKFANDPDGWKSWARTFYDDHAGFIGHVLKLPSNVARSYADAQFSALATQGLPATTDWDSRVVRHLTQLALGEDAEAA
jgi:HK97 family phage portal protein